MAVRISEATQATPQLIEALGRLVPQLSKTAPAPKAEEVAAIVESPATSLLVAEDEDTGEILGTLTLCVFRIPTGLRAWIEDVVVDSGAAGRAIGEQLSRAALDVARNAGASTVDLTSRPSREAANHIYRKIGFEPRETNVYRFKLGS